MRNSARTLLAALGICMLTAGNTAADTKALRMLDPNLKVATLISAGLVQPTPVLDLAVNSNSERGLLSLVLHPNFPATPWVYVRWTESSTGVDTTSVLQVPLLGNRVDRFVWNGSTLTFDRNVISLRSLQTDNLVAGGHTGTNNAN